MSSAVIEVRAWGKRVGAVAPDPNLGYYVFAYAPQWLKAGIELAPRTMPVANYRGPYIFTNIPEATYQRLPGMLSDALPDEFGNALINAWMQSKGRDFGKTEFAYYLMAKAAGIQISECRLLHENGRAHFMTKRFDRTGDDKHHVQTLCAMEHMDFKQLATHSYAQAFMVIAALKLGQDFVDELFRRMAFNVMARNCDDHTKNLAFILRQGQSWALAPAYDVTHAYNPTGEWTFQHQMSVNGKFKDITRADLLEDAERFGVRSPKKLLGDVAAAVGSFDQFAKEAELPNKKRDVVRKSFCLL